MKLYRIVIIVLYAELAVLALMLAYFAGRGAPGRFQLVSWTANEQQGKVLLDTASGAVYRLEPKVPEKTGDVRWTRFADPA